MIKKAISHLISKGFILDELLPDGDIHRFKVGDSKDKSGWAACHHSGLDDEHYSIVFGNWREGGQDVYHTNENISDEAVSIFKINLKKVNHKLQKQKIEVAEKCLSEWNTFETTGENDYLKRKKINALYGARLDKNDLIIPCHDIDGKLWGYQRISESGKFFQSGQRTKGCFHQIGELVKGLSVLYVCEGFATGASLHMAYKDPIFCAFNAGNLKQVAEDLAKKYTEYRIIIAADNDQFKDNNVGMSKAKESGFEFIYPTFDNLETNPTDFNDLYCLEGPEALFKNPEDFPTHLIPEPFKSYVKQESRMLEVPIAMVLFPLVSIFSGLFAKHKRAKAISFEKYVAPIFIWNMGIMEKGSKKSGALKAGAKFVDAIQDRLQDNCRKKMKKNKIKILTKKSILSKKLTTVESKIEEQFEDREQARQELEKLMPPSETLTLNQATTAALIEDFHDTDYGIINVLDEISSLFSTLGNEFSTGQRQLLLQAHNGDEVYKKKTKGMAPIEIRDFCITLAGNTQPAIFKNLFGGGNLVVENDGLIERVQLITSCEELKPMDTIKKPYVDKYTDNVSNLFDAAWDSIHYFDEQTKEYCPKIMDIINFTEGAEDCYIKFRNKIKRMKFATKSSYMKGYIAKTTRTAISLSTIFFLIDNLYHNKGHKKIQVCHIERASHWVDFLIKVEAPKIDAML